MAGRFSDREYQRALKETHLGDSQGKRTVRDIRLTTVDNFNYQLCISNYVRGKKK